MNFSKMLSLQFTPHASHFTFHLLRFTLYVFLLLASPVLAQSPEANVEFYRVSPPKDQPITVGDPVTLRLEVSHPVDSTADLPQLEVGQAWGSFEVVSQSQPEIIDNHDGTATTAQNVVVTVFEPGQFQTPSVVVTHRRADDATEELGSPVIQLTVSSVLTDDLSLRDLKPQADLPLPPVWPYILAGVVATMLLVGLLAGLVFWLYDRRRRVKLELTPAIPADTRPPEVIAYAELDRIETLNLPAQQRIKEHYSLVDLCLRRYIEGRYQIPALEQTSAELRRAFRRSSAPAEHAANFMSLFSESDLVKFARYTPEADNIYSLINRARTIVGLTTPQVEAAPEPAAPKAEAVL
jgi:hypothetical protein